MSLLRSMTDRKCCDEPVTRGGDVNQFFSIESLLHLYFILPRLAVKKYSRADADRYLKRA